MRDAIRDEVKFVMDNHEDKVDDIEGSISRLKKDVKNSNKKVKLKI